MLHRVHCSAWWRNFGRDDNTAQLHFHSRRILPITLFNYVVELDIYCERIAYTSPLHSCVIANSVFEFTNFHYLGNKDRSGRRLSINVQLANTKNALLDVKNMGLYELTYGKLGAKISKFLPAWRYASAGNSDRNVSVRPSVRLSVRQAPVLCQNEESWRHDFFTIWYSSFLTPNFIPKF